MLSEALVHDGSSDDSSQPDTGSETSRAVITQDAGGRCSTTGFDFARRTFLDMPQVFSVYDVSLIKRKCIDPYEKGFKTEQNVGNQPL